MSSSGWQRRLIPLAKGEHDENTANVGEVGITTAANCSFGVHGAVSGRPGMIRSTGFLTRDVSGFPQQHLTQQSATTQTPMAMFGVKDGNGERPALITRGKLWTQEPTANNSSAPWIDRLGCSTMVNRRRHDALLVPDVVIGGYGTCVVPVAPTFMPCPSQNNVILTSSLEGGITGHDAITTALAGPGTAARCGTKDAVIYTENNNLVIIINDITSPGPVRTVLAADAATTTGFGDAPCICCDFDSSVFFVIYRTTTTHTYKILSVTTGGVPTIMTTSTFGTATLWSVWITNSSVATNRLVIGLSDTLTATTSRLHNMTTGAALFFDIAHGAGTSTLDRSDITVGVAANGICYYYVGTRVTGLTVGFRSLTAPTDTVLFSCSATGSSTGSQFVSPRGGFGSVSQSDQGTDFWPLTQPMLVDNRILIGFVGISRWTQRINGAAVPAGNYNQLGTWYIFDITDLGATLTQPSLAAMGPFEGSQVPWQCPSGVVIFDPTLDGQTKTKMTFPSLDWSRFDASVITPRGQVTDAGVATIKGTYNDITGHEGSLGLNEVFFQAPQVSYFNNSTLISGSSPRQIAGDFCFPVGFPFVGRPSLTITGNALTGATPFSQNYVAVWKYVDAKGQIHRSMPSPEIKVSGVSGGITFSFSVSNPPITERDTQCFIEIYATQPSPASGAPHYLWGNPGFTTGGTPALVNSSTGGATSFAFNGLNTGALLQTEQTLYTDGNTFQNEPVGGSGGLIAIANRCWMSDGVKVYASKLGQEGEGPAWNSDGPLTLDIPVSAGFILNLGQIDDKVVILCEHGIYVTTGAGPDDTGQGPQFAIPVKMADVATQPGRTCVSTPRGLMFLAALSPGADPLSTGPWLLGRDLILTNMSSRTQALVDATVAGQVAYLPEREWFAWCTNDGLLWIWDVRTDNWSFWTPASTSSDTLIGIVGAAAGLLWTDGTEPSKWQPNQGVDFDGANKNFSMSVTTNNIPIIENDRLGWGKIRCFRILGEPASHQLTTNTTQDDAFTSSNTLTITISGGSTWPSTGRYAPEIRLPRSKCSVIRVQMSATPGNAIWSALELQTRPLSAGAPSAQRQ